MLAYDDLSDLTTYLVDTVVHQGPQDYELLARRARTRGVVPPTFLDRPEKALKLAVWDDVRLALYVDGTVRHLRHVLEGAVFTQRLSSPTLGRTDLWMTDALSPLLVALSGEDGDAVQIGDVRLDHLPRPVLVGPDGWLPDLPAGDLIGVRWRDGRLAAEPIGDGVWEPERVQAARGVLARTLSEARWMADTYHPMSPGELVTSVSHGIGEVPHLFHDALPPLGELLHDPTHARKEDYWRALGQSFAGGETVSFSIERMPSALEHELLRRSRHYRMSIDEYVITALGHLAWRTPFAEDLGEWESWADGEAREADVFALGAAGAAPGPAPS